MQIRKKEKHILSEKAVRAIDEYLSITDNARLSVGIYYKGEKFLLDLGYDDTEYLYDIGSLSKTLTAHIILYLENEGSLNLSDTVDKYLPLREGRYPSIYELLTHTAGYKHLTPLEITLPSLIFHRYSRRNPYETVCKNKIVRALERRRHHRSHKYSYSDFSYAILALIAERVTKTEFHKLLSSFISDELSMNETKLFPSSEQRTPKSAGKKEIKFWNWSEDNPYIGSGGVSSTVSDVLKYISIEIESDKKFIADAHKLNEKTLSDKRNYGAAIGWHVYKKSNKIWQVGGVGCFRCSVAFNKKRKIGVVVLGNAKGKKRANVHHIANMIFSECKTKKTIFQ